MIIDEFYKKIQANEFNYKDYSLNLLLIIFSIVSTLIALLNLFFIHKVADLMVDISLTLLSLLLLYINKKYKKYLLVATIFFWTVAILTFIIVFLHKFDTILLFLLLTSIIAFLILPIKEALINLAIYEFFVALILYYGYINYRDLRPDLFSFYGFLHFIMGTIYLMMFWIFYHFFVEKTMENLAKLNREKTLLLNEIQHRVKNNFNMILSILKMQHNYNFKSTKEFVDVFSKRVESIVIAHDLLFNNKNVDKINLKKYITNLTQHIVGKHLDKIEIEYNLIDVIMPIDQSIYIGIMLNEMLTNTLKYAFDENGKIFISLKGNSNGYKLIYYDSGKKSSKEIKSESLGIMIIKMSVEQLNGNLKQEGYRYEIEFKLEEI